MDSKKDFSDIFDENFEVTYEETPDFSPDTSGDTIKIPDTKRNSAADDSDLYYEDEDDLYDEDDDYYDDDIDQDEYDDDYDDDYDDSRRKRKRDRNDTDDYDSASDRRSSRGGKSRKRRGGVPLAAPIQKGGKAVSRLTGFLVRQLTMILIIATAVYVTYTFWRASPPYGDIIESFQQRTITQTLAAYLSCVAIFLLFEFISLLWAMTRTRVRNGLDSWKEDSGRGLTSFIIVFAASYVCFLFSGFIPETPEAIYGIKGAMEVYGSMHNVLLGLCAAGVISCLVRKYKPY